MTYEAKYEECTKDDDVIDYEYRAKLVIRHNGEVIRKEFDGGEPEDNTFNRDWNWIAGELNKAYQLGFKDGRGNA